MQPGAPALAYLMGRGTVGTSARAGGRRRALGARFGVDVCDHPVPGVVLGGS